MQCSILLIFFTFTDQFQAKLVPKSAWNWNKMIFYSAQQILQELHYCGEFGSVCLTRHNDYVRNIEFVYFVSYSAVGYWFVFYWGQYSKFE